jgi:tetratricopeptide (TPR) repeat protein
MCVFPGPCPRFTSQRNIPSIMKTDPRPLRSDWHWAARLAFAAAVAAFIAGCATAPPPAPAPAPAPPPKAPEPVAAPTPPPAPLVPEQPPAQATAEAQNLAIAAIDMLQNGDEANAKTTLEKALAYDPANDLAKKLMDQIKADAQTELGSTFFRYTVQRDDSLSKIAQAYMGDRFRFYILAKYNDIANPSKLAAGQVIKVPGRAPATPPPRARPAAPAPATAEPAAAPAPAVAAPAEPEAPKKTMSSLMQQGMAQQKAGNLDAAYASFSEAVRAEPGNKEAATQRDAVKVALVRRYDREAVQAYQRQNLDLAIKKWDQILELDPNNQKAKLERERAVELKKKMAEKFGTAK